MNYADFKIGEAFWVDGNEWRCLDIATAHILAVPIQAHIVSDPSWLNGPPYAVELTVLDANDWPVCFKSYKAWKAAYDD